MLKIGKRSIIETLKLLIRKEIFNTLKNFFAIYKNPIKAMFNEFFTKGKYPCILEMKNGMKIKLYSHGDFSTLNLVFCREDYLADKKIKTIVDIGSNIGISALYWIYKNPKAQVYCFEPSKINYERLIKNTKNFRKNIEINKYAISDFNGKSKLYISKNGVNDSIIEISSKKFQKIRVMEINHVLERIFKKHKKIDIVKIDAEGCDKSILKKIKKKYLKKIRIINIEGKGYNALLPDYFNYSFVGSASRFVNKGLE